MSRRKDRNPGGRPPRDPAGPGRLFGFRATEQERAAYERAAKAKGAATPSDWARALLNEAAQKGGR